MRRNCILIFIFLWVYFKNKKVKTGNYGNYSYYDKLTDRLDAKLGHDSSFMIQHYLDPENCPLYGNLPTLSQLVNLNKIIHLNMKNWLMMELLKEQ